MKLNKIITICLTACVILCTGCQKVAKTGEIFDRYEKTELRASSSADVLARIHDFETDYLTQSESVVASWGTDKKAHKLWFNVVAFDEDQLTAVRKYAMIANEKSKGFLVAPEQKIRFECTLVLPEEVLDQPYSNENNKRIAILKAMLASFSDDIDQLADDSRELKSAAMMTKQTINAALTTLNRSPAYARDLTDPDGMEFYHMPMGKSRINMYLQNDTVEVRIKVGKGWFHKPIKLF